MKNTEAGSGGKVALETQSNSPCSHIPSSFFPGKCDTEASSNFSKENVDPVDGQLVAAH